MILLITFSTWQNRLITIYIITGKVFEKTQQIINNTELIYVHLENSLCSKNKDYFK